MVLMVKRRKLLIAIGAILLTFLLTTYYLLKVLTNAEVEVNNEPTIEEKIYEELLKLPEQYKIKQGSNVVVDKVIKNLKNINNVSNVVEVWNVANSWVNKNGIIDLSNPNLGVVFTAVKTVKIIKADLDVRGTQLKLLLTLEGNQKVVFKPKWYEINRIIDGPVYAGKDRFFAEIIGFYLSLILEMRSTPLSALRVVSLKDEVMPVATQRLKEASYQKNNKTCVYGICFYCKIEDPICEIQGSNITGAVVFNIDGSLKTYRSPWQRTYKKGKKASWETNENYCRILKDKLPKQRLLDLVDTAIFDFLIQNGDRHHYQTLYNRIILLDNGKGFGNPNVHHIDILAPLYQCCILRRTTWNRLRSLSGGALREYLTAMPDVEKILTDNHLRAVEDRLLIIFATVEYCRGKTKSTLLH